MKRDIIKYFKLIITIILLTSMLAPSYAALSSSDGSSFVTKAEFDSSLAEFNSRLTTFEAGINSKIDSQVTSYLDRNGIWSAKQQTLMNNLDIGYCTIGNKMFNTDYGSKTYYFPSAPSGGGQLTYTSGSTTCKSFATGGEKYGWTRVVDAFNKSGLLYCEVDYRVEAGESAGNLTNTSNGWTSYWNTLSNEDKKNASIVNSEYRGTTGLYWSNAHYFSESGNSYAGGEIWLNFEMMLYEADGTSLGEAYILKLNGNNWNHYIGNLTSVSVGSSLHAKGRLISMYFVKKGQYIESGFHYGITARNAFAFGCGNAYNSTLQRYNKIAVY